MNNVVHTYDYSVSVMPLYRISYYSYMCLKGNKNKALSKICVPCVHKVGHCM